MAAVGSFTGLGSGIDWRSVVDQIIQVDSQPIRRMEGQIKEADADKKAWGELHTLLSDFRSLNNDLRFGRTFESIGAEAGKTSGGIQAFTATADQTAAEASYQVEVIDTARAETMASGSNADSTTALGLTGDFTLNGVTVTVAATDSLGTIRDSINASGAGVTATVLKIADGDFRLSIKSDETGAAGITYADGAGAVGSSLGLATSVAGRDALFVIDGTAFTRTTNTISDAIGGVTLELATSSAGETVTLDVAADTGEMAEAMEAWTKAYNDVVEFLNKHQTVGEDKKELALRDKGALTRMGESMLRQALGGSLFEVGIEVTREGTLSFDKAAFDAAWKADPAAVETRLKAGVGADMDAAILGFGIDPESIVNNGTAAAERRIASLDAQKARWESRMEVRRQSLLRTFNQVETMMAQMNGQAQSLAGLGGSGLMGMMTQV